MKVIDTIRDYVAITVVALVMAFAWAVGRDLSFGAAVLIFAGHFAVISIVVHALLKFLGALSNERPRKDNYD